MIISFASRYLRKVCCNIEFAECELGNLYAQALIAVIADAEAFDNAGEIVAFYEQDAHVSDDDSLRLALGSNQTAVFVAVGAKFDRDQSGRVVWASVQRLKLVEVSGCK